MSKKVWFTSTTAVVVFLALSMVGSAFAQAPVPASPFPNGTTPDNTISVPASSTTIVTPPPALLTTYNSTTSSTYNSAIDQNSVINKYMIKYLASELGLKRYIIQARLAAGETLYQIVESEGYTYQQAVDMVNEAYAEAYQTALLAGAITQQQVNWMSQRTNQTLYGWTYSNQVPSPNFVPVP